MHSESPRTFHGVPISDRLKVTTPSDLEIAMTRHFDAPREMVYAAWTRPELLKRWLYGPPDWQLAVCEMDLRPGGALRWVWRGPDGRDMGVSGSFREIVPPSRLVWTELFDEDWTGGESLVTLEFAERDGGTFTTMTALYSSRQARDGALSSGMELGLSYDYDVLDGLLQSEGAQWIRQGGAHA